MSVFSLLCQSGNCAVSFEHQLDGERSRVTPMPASAVLVAVTVAATAADIAEESIAPATKAVEVEEAVADATPSTAGIVFTS